MKKYIKHIIKEGSREHVLSWLGTAYRSYTRCSDPDCIINKDWDRDMARLKSSLSQLASPNASVENRT